MNEYGSTKGIKFPIFIGMTKPKRDQDYMSIKFDHYAQHIIKFHDPRQERLIKINRDIMSIAIFGLHGFAPSIELEDKFIKLKNVETRHERRDEIIAKWEERKLSRLLKADNQSKTKERSVRL